jgi:ubiquinone biosynthesis protein COQ9
MPPGQARLTSERALGAANEREMIMTQDQSNGTLDLTDQLIDAILTHVTFDGWSDEAFRAALGDTDISPDLARVLFPRGARDLARAWHDRGDHRMVEALTNADLAEMRFRDRVAYAVRLRINCIEDREALRRAMVQNILPLNTPEGARMLWQTADHIWTALGDSSQDYNYYTKRLTLSGVIGSTLLFWLGDESYDHQPTWDFLDRRIDNVMQFEKVKAQMGKGPLARLLNPETGPLSFIRAPKRPDDLPGQSRP